MNTAAYYITTPIYYVNDQPHLGSAYTSTACDVLARYHRLLGRKVRFLTGTDEHGQKVEKSARAAGVPPKEFVDRVSSQFRDLSSVMGLSNDDFIRTTEPRHVRSAQALWTRMQENGHIYLGSYAGWYAVRDEAYYQESELVGGKAPTGAEVEWVEEPSYFFNLSQWQEKLLHFYEEHPGFIAPASRRNEVIRFVEGGLKDLSISRTTFSWGIPVPGDERHIMYVWLDALANYISAIGFPDTHSADFSQFWPADLHMVGKDILRFHAVYWPAFLMAADLPPPRKIFAHGWWTVEGEKMSKSLGNVVAPRALVDAFGLDQTRYFLMREVPFGQDGNFSRSAFIQRVNSELANNIGNLAQRTLSMIHKNCGGTVPQCRTPDARDGEFLRLVYEDTPRRVHAALEELAFHQALEAIVQLGFEANKYIDEQAPWKLKKEQPERMEQVLYVLAESIRVIALLLQPFIPDSSSKILDLLAIGPDARGLECATAAHALTPGAILPEPVAIFPRLTDDAATDARHAAG